MNSSNSFTSDPDALKAIEAANESARKLLELKKKLGQNIVIEEEGEIKIIPASEYQLDQSNN